MSKLLVFFLLLLLISCDDEKPVQKGKPKPVVVDSGQTITSNRTSKTWTPVDVSPMDMTYYPVDYPKLHNPPSPAFARIIYSRPHLQGRKLFGDILHYGQPWRMGANEATELDLYKPATIAGKKIKEGRYIIYCIPEKDHWTIVLNKNIDSWGLHRDPSQDVEKFQIPVKTTNDSIEFFTMLFRDSETNTPELYMAWDNIEAVLPFSF
jgi:hypothetical protein